MSKIVLDTNILVSALLSSNISVPALCLDLIISQKDKLVLTKEIIEEYQEVLARPKFGFDKSQISQIILHFKKHGILVTPKKHFYLCIDPDDNIFLDAAFAGKASFVITGNTRHFPQICSFTHIVTPKQFIETHN